MSEVGEFIEMGREGDEDLNTADDDFGHRAEPFRALLRAIWWPPSLGLAAIMIATVTLITTGAASDVGDLVVYTHQTANASVTSLRWATGFRVAVSGLALLLAVIGAIRYASDERLAALDRILDREDDDADDEAEGADEGVLARGFAPTWIQVIMGAALLVGLVAVIVNGIAFVDALQTHVPGNFGFSSG